MKYPDRLIGSIARQASDIAGRDISEHMIRLALGFKFRAEKGLTLDEACLELGNNRPRNYAEDHNPYTRQYGRRIARDFGIAFPDYAPETPLNLPLE